MIVLIVSPNKVEIRLFQSLTSLHRKHSCLLEFKSEGNVISDASNGDGIHDASSTYKNLGVPRNSFFLPYLIVSSFFFADPGPLYFLLPSKSNSDDLERKILPPPTTAYITVWGLKITEIWLEQVLDIVLTIFLIFKQ